MTVLSTPKTVVLVNTIEMADAIDNEDGNLSTSIHWTSSIDGNIGSGVSVNVTLSEGTHTITATVTDNNGVTPEFASTLNVTVTQGGAQ